MASVASFAVSALALLKFTTAQQIGSAETHSQLITQKCTTHGGCVNQMTSVVLDSGSHAITGANCSSCSTVAECGHECYIQGISSYVPNGVDTSGDSITLHQYLNGNEVSPRVYLLDESGKHYNMLSLLNQEIAFTVDVSNLPCGMNGALYMSEMDKTGGRSPLNPAGAEYGTGYCDAQCGGSAWINGKRNLDNYGSCCQEMDLWEANARSNALTPHACNTTGLVECSGAACGEAGDGGLCDKDGCGFNAYGLGDKTYYGYGDTVDTNKTFTVVTQFLTDDGTSSGTLNQIRRVYVQDGKVIQNAQVEFNGAPLDSITNAFCEADSPTFTAAGGLTQMSKAIGDGMVLVFSIWNDPSGNMTWLDTGNAGPCSTAEGNPSIIEKNDPSTSVTWSAVKWGDINSTYMAMPEAPLPPMPPMPPMPPSPPKGGPPPPPMHPPRSAHFRL